MAWFMGIDIGSVTSKGVITEDGEVRSHLVIPSGANYAVAAQTVREELLRGMSLSPERLTCTLATGCGALSVSFADRRVGDLVCSARGINRVFLSARTLIDIGGQSTQVIRIDEQGRVVNFLVSEKCAAGSGRFLQIIGDVLRVGFDDIGSLSLKSQNPVTFTTGCAVFGESEAITRVCEGISREDILAGVHKALAEKVSALISGVGLQQECAMSGGGALDIGLIKSIEKRLGVHLLIPSHPQTIAALGAALLAERASHQLESKGLAL